MSEPTCVSNLVYELDSGLNERLHWLTSKVRPEEVSRLYDPSHIKASSLQDGMPYDDGLINSQSFMYTYHDIEHRSLHPSTALA